MKKRRKTSKCLNCGDPLNDAYNYCPNCGQENSDRQISFGQLVNDFFSNYFSLDSRFGRSFKPFFFKPGFLTREFMDGKRVTYANPIRLYLVVSLIHFFTLSLYTSSTNEESSNQPLVDLSVDEERAINKADSIARSEDADTTDFTLILSGREWTIIGKMSKDHTLEEISDSLHLEEKTFVQRHVAQQAIKVMKADEASIESYILENIPILMFLLLPLYALLLKLFFRKKLYINHLVHSLHIHSFVFIVLTLYWIAALIATNIPGTVNILMFFLLTFYIIVSFKNTYYTTKWRATYKVLLSGFIYWILMLSALMLEMIISLLTF